MTTRQWVAWAERGALALLCVWLVWIPLPFGSNVPRARAPLVLVPLFLCAAAAALRLAVARDRNGLTAKPTRPWLIWSSGALLFLLVGLGQLVPLPRALHQAVSPESHAVWERATITARLAGVAVRESWPLSVDPTATAVELFRLAGLLASFVAASILVRTPERRVVLALTLCAAALFETFYGVREAALGRYEIWGWPNRLVFNRVTGTYVNPNHFAHYVALVVPMALFLAALVWRRAGRGPMSLARRLAHVIERDALAASGALLVTIACLAAILLSGSRGALLATVCAIGVAAAMLPGGRRTRVLTGGIAGVVLIVALVLFLGPQRTVSRFLPSESERQTLVGRSEGISAGIGIWQRFPLLGCGLGAFSRVVFMEQRDAEKIFHHVHDDYVEIAATSGALGFTIALAALLGGYLALVRMTVGSTSSELTWRRRAFQLAALTSLTMAMVHALFDFNFFIPANAATLAVICGSAVAALDHDRLTRR